MKKFLREKISDLVKWFVIKYQNNKKTINLIVTTSIVILFLILLDLLAQIIPGLNIIADYIKNYQYFLGFCLGWLIVIWSLYVIIKNIKEKLDDLVLKTGVLWLKTFRGVVKFVKTISSLVGYPTTEIGKINYTLSTDGLKMLKDIMDGLQEYVGKIAIFGTITIIMLILGATFPASITVHIIFGILIIIAFSVMGFTEPLVKPLEGKSNVRNVIKPVSVVLAILGSIFLLFAHGPEIYRRYLDPFTIYLFFLIILSFRSYHGKWVSKSVRTVMHFTILFLAISLLIKTDMVGNSEPYKYVENRLEDVNTLLANKNYKDELNLHQIAKSGYVYQLQNGKPAKTLLKVEKNQIVARGDNNMTYFKEILSEIWIQNNDSLFIEGPYYYPARLLVKLKNKRAEPQNVNIDQVNHYEEEERNDVPALSLLTDIEYVDITKNDFVILPFFMEVGQKAIIKTASGNGFYIKTVDYGTRLFPSGTSFDQVIKYAPFIVKKTVPYEETFILIPYNRNG